MPMGGERCTKNSLCSSARTAFIGAPAAGGQGSQYSLIRGKAQASGLEPVCAVGAGDMPHSSAAEGGKKDRGRRCSARSSHGPRPVAHVWQLPGAQAQPPTLVSL